MRVEEKGGREEGKALESEGRGVHTSSPSAVPLPSLPALSVHSSYAHSPSKLSTSSAESSNCPLQLPCEDLRVA